GSTPDNFYVKAFKGQKIWANRLSRALVIGGIFVLLLFPSWQLFSGSFFPSGYVPGISGNGIPTLGSFSPSEVPQAMLDTYNWMLDQSGNFNIYWPGPEGAAYPWNNKSSTSIAQVDSPRETFLTQAKFPAALQYLLRSNLTVDIAPYLAALNIKYIVLQPYSKTGLEYSWGIGDFQRLQTIIHNARGLSLVRSQDGILVYSVSNPW